LFIDPPLCEDKDNRGYYTPFFDEWFSSIATANYRICYDIVAYTSKLEASAVIIHNFRLDGQTLGVLSGLDNVIARIENSLAKTQRVFA
jgi:hypothetical protein